MKLFPALVALALVSLHCNALTWEAAVKDVLTTTTLPVHTSCRGLLSGAVQAQTIVEKMRPCVADPQKCGEFMDYTFGLYNPNVYTIVFWSSGHTNFGKAAAFRFAQELCALREPKPAVVLESTIVGSIIDALMNPYKGTHADAYKSKGVFQANVITKDFLKNRFPWHEIANRMLAIRKRGEVIYSVQTILRKEAYFWKNDQFKGELWQLQSDVKQGPATTVAVIMTDHAAEELAHMKKLAKPGETVSGYTTMADFLTGDGKPEVLGRRTTNTVTLYQCKHKLSIGMRYEHAQNHFCAPIEDDHENGVTHSPFEPCNYVPPSRIGAPNMANFIFSDQNYQEIQRPPQQRFLEKLLLQRNSGALQPRQSDV